MFADVSFGVCARETGKDLLQGWQFAKVVD
jgi:hypothetical protein